MIKLISTIISIIHQTIILLYEIILIKPINLNHKWEMIYNIYQYLLSNGSIIILSDILWMKNMLQINIYS